MKNLTSNLRFLYNSSCGLLSVWFLLTLASMTLELIAINSILPLIWQSDSDIKRITQNIYAFFGIGNEHLMGGVIVVVAVAYVLRNILLTCQCALSAKISTKIQVNIKTQLLNKIANVGYLHLSKINVGVLNNTIHKESNGVSIAIGNLINATSHGIFALVTVLLLMALNPSLIAAILCVALLLLLCMRKMTKILQQLSLEITHNYGHIQSWLVQILSSHALKYLKTTQTYGKVSKIVKEDITRQGKLLYKQQRLSYLIHNTTDLILILLMLCGLFIYAVILDHSIVEAIFILFILRRAMLYAMSCQASYRQYLDAHGSVEIVKKIDNELSEYEKGDNHDAVVPDLCQSILMKNVSFYYHESSTVLNNINMNISMGSNVAIVGSSGEGKSTLFMLLTGVIKPTSGSVLLGNIPYDKLNMDIFRSEIGYVSQENIIFNDSVINNVTLWDQEPSMAKFKASLAAVDVEGLIKELPECEKTSLGDGGNILSGGQRQRIAIARELYKNPQILILDEATSGLDGIAELSVLENIQRINKDTTLIAVTHRIASTRKFDMIYVLENGAIIEQGSYTELYNANGVFRSMAIAQGL